MRWKSGLKGRIGVSGGLIAMLLFSPGFAEEPFIGQRSVPDNAQTAAITFFNKVAQESSNPYIMAGARESAARLTSNPEHGATRLSRRVEVPVISQ